MKIAVADDLVAFKIEKYEPIIFWVVIFSVVWGVMESELFLWRTDGLNDSYNVSYHLLMIFLALIVLLIIPFVTKERKDLILVFGVWHLWSLVQDISFILHRNIFYDLPFGKGLPYILIAREDLGIPLWYITHSITIIVSFSVWIKVR